MPIYVYRHGKLVEKRKVRRAVPAGASELPAPAVQSFEAYASPIDGQTISSHRQRDKDLDASGSYDKRDTPQSFEKARDARRASDRRAAKLATTFA